MRTLDEIRAPFDAGVAGLELERSELFRLDNPYWDDDPAVFAREGEDRAAGLLDDFLRALEDRVATDPDRSRRDYTKTLVICRKTDGTERIGTLPSA